MNATIARLLILSTILSVFTSVFATPVANAQKIKKQEVIPTCAFTEVKDDRKGVFQRTGLTFYGESVQIFTRYTDEKGKANCVWGDFYSTSYDAMGRDLKNFEEAQLVLETLIKSIERRGYIVITLSRVNGRPDQAWTYDSKTGQMMLITIFSESNLMGIGPKGSKY